MALGSVPTRGFFGTWGLLFQRHLGLLAIFVCCIAIVAHIIVTTLPPFGGIKAADESLLALAQKTKQLGQHASSAPIVTLAGYTLSDQNDWLNPSHLGLRAIERPGVSGIGSSFFDADLWDDQLAYLDSESGSIKTSKALPTNAWWQPWVMSPGTGSTRTINQHPYTLSVISKEESTKITNGADRAGIEVLAPFVEMIDASDGSVFGVQQAKGSKQIGLFMGVELADMGDYVERHVVESYGPLEVTKRWDLSTLPRADDGTALLDSKKISSFIRTRVIRGSSFISMELPSSVFFILDTLAQDITKGTKNSMVRISSFDATMTDHATSCSGLSKNPMTSDSIELTLADKTKWVLVFDQKISMICSSTTTGDRLISSTPLISPVLARLAIVDMSDHEDVVNDVIPGAKDMTPAAWAKRSSEIRWKLLGDIKKNSNGSVSKFVSELNKGSTDIHETLKARFTKFPLRDQLQSLSKTLGYNLTVARWNENELLQQMDAIDPDIIIIPENFIEDPNAFWVSDNFKNSFTSGHIGGGRTVLGIGGTQSGTITTFFDKVLKIGLEPLAIWNAKTDDAIKQLKEIADTLPINQDSIGTDPMTLPINMPKSLSKPTGANSVEMVRTAGGGWPFVSYCRPSALGSSSTNAETCDGAVHTYYYVGRGGVQWIGMDWADVVETASSDWTKVLARAIQASACTEGRKVAGKCRGLSRVLLVSDVDAALQEEMVTDLSNAIVARTEVKLPDGTITEKDTVDLSKTLSYLKGMKEEYTGNIGDETTTLVDSDTESLRDFVLRHALMVPVASTVKVEMSDRDGMLHYTMEVKALQSVQQHSLYPPTGKSTSDLLWDPYRAMYYLTPMQRKLEYGDRVGHFSSLAPVSLEDDSTTCLPSVVGALCGRSFGPSPACRMPETVPTSTQSTDSRPYCTFSIDGTLDLDSWDPIQVRDDLINGKSALFSHQKSGTPFGVMVKFPTADWDLFIRKHTGEYTSLEKAIHPKWLENIKWAVSEDVGGTWKLDGDVWAKDDAADDLNTWARMIHRYAQIALVADSVGLRNERRTVIGWLETALLKFFNNRFDNQGLLYDTTWGGIVPCGCDRDMGKKFCVPPPRMGYFDQTNSPQGVSSWMSQSCPALSNAAKEGGAGYFADHHALWGYIVFSTAVATRFDPTFANRRVRLQTSAGVKRPKIHHVIMSLIQDYANPMLVEPYESSKDPEVSAILHRHFPGARYKDWWRMHSYGSGIATPEGTGPSQYSLSEAAFGYWAASLYASTVGDTDLSRWAKLLTGMEMMAGNAFWHIKEYTETVPSPLRYLGSAGKVSESSISFQTKYSVAPYEVFHNQMLPLNILSFEALEPGWVLWMHQRFKASCQNDASSCSEAGADLGLVLLDFMATDWKEKSGAEPLTDEAELPSATKGIAGAVSSIVNVPCFQMGSYDCGMHTLTNSMYLTALAYTWGGTPEALSRDDGNGRFQVY